MEVCDVYLIVKFKERNMILLFKGRFALEVCLQKGHGQPLSIGKEYLT